MSEQEIYCINHPERAALEKCEICGKPLCGYCLYYTEDGQRLCEQHALHARESGLSIIPPAVYASGIISSQADASRQAKLEEIPLQAEGGKRGARYQGNDNDLLAFVSMFLGMVIWSSCCGAIYCLPFVGVLVGIIALMNAKDSFNPRRTRQQAWIGIGTGGCFVLIVLGIIGMYVFAWGALVTNLNTTSHGGFNVFPTNTVTVAPTYTNPPAATPDPNIEPAQQTATARADQNDQVMPLSPIAQTATAVKRPIP